MKTWLKVVGAVVGGIVAIPIGGIGWLALRSPEMRAPSSDKVDPTPERVARGRYLAHHVADCINCHSDHALDRYGMPVKPGTEGTGGMVLDEKAGVPGVVTAQNITPALETGVGRWTDGEIMRAFREGVDREGRALFPMMPYEGLRAMSDEDARSVVAYLRTLKPIENRVPEREIAFPVNLLIKFAPKPIDHPVEAPDDARDHLGYGKYLVTIAGCGDCHTPHDDHGQPIAGRAFAGGWEMKGPWGRLVTPNLTPHPRTFVGHATKEQFVARFKAFDGTDATNAPLAPEGRNTVMPWLSYAGMTPKDLGAVYDYLRSIQPIENDVNPFPVEEPIADAR